LKSGVLLRDMDSDEAMLAERLPPLTLFLPYRSVLPIEQAGRLKVGWPKIAELCGSGFNPTPRNVGLKPDLQLQSRDEVMK
jgi:hypothetical protein